MQRLPSSQSTQLGQVPVLVAAVTNRCLYWRHAHPVIGQLINPPLTGGCACSETNVLIETDQSGPGVNVAL